MVKLVEIVCTILRRHVSKVVVVFLLLLEYGSLSMSRFFFYYFLFELLSLAKLGDLISSTEKESDGLLYIKKQFEKNIL